MTNSRNIPVKIINLITAISLCFPALLCPAFAQAPLNVLTANYDNARTNANTVETVLTPSAMKSGPFGRLFTLPVDGQIYAQPLYQQNVILTDQSQHNLVFIATEHNSVYAFDGDKPGPPVWTMNLGPSVPAANYTTQEGPYTDIYPEIGITGTPVIDPATNTLYVVASTLENGTYYHRLHALDTLTGREKLGGPSVIGAQVSGSGDSSSGGSVPFVASQHLQRPALLLLNGVVYVAFGSHGDITPYHGWVFGYDALNVQNQLATFNATPNGWGGAFWQSGRGPAADAQGNLFMVSSNGDSDQQTNFSDNVLRLSASKLAVMDWFAPFNVQELDANDEDLGSCGAMLIPGTNLLLTGGKQGYMYLMSTQSMGGISAGNSQIVQTFQVTDFGVFNMALWNRTGGPLLYLHGINDAISSYQMKSNLFQSTPASQSTSLYGSPYQGMTISANGGAPGTGILWMTTPDLDTFPSSGTLHAFNAEDLTQELWNSSAKGTDKAGLFSKFANPTVINGKVYLPTGSNQVVVYGMQSGTLSGSPVITGLVNAASYAAGPVAPGEIVAVFGQNLGPATPVSGSFDPNRYLIGDLAGTEVTFNGTPAPLLYTSANQLGAVVPFEIAGATSVAVQAEYNGLVSAVQNFPVGAVAPGIFSLDSSGIGQGVILNKDYTLNSAKNPAPPASYIIVYATGGGQTTAGDQTGFAAPSAAQPVAAAVTATVGGQPAQVSYAGDAPTEISGLMQINIQLPISVAGRGSVPVVLTMAGTKSQQTVTVYVK